jgi:hypothetical protein
MVRYQQQCYRCKKNYVLITFRDRFPVCYDCAKSELNKKIKDPAMKKMFNIPEDFYKENPFLRSIKLNYIRYKDLSEKQIEAFKTTVARMKLTKIEAKDLAKVEKIKAAKAKKIKFPR